MVGPTLANVVDGALFVAAAGPDCLFRSQFASNRSPAALRFASPGTVQITPCRFALLVGHVCGLGSLGRYILTAGIARVEGVRNQVVRIPCHAVKLTSIEDNDIALAVVVEMILGKVIVIVDVVFGHGVYIRLRRL